MPENRAEELEQAIVSALRKDAAERDTRFKKKLIIGLICGLILSGIIGFSMWWVMKSTFDNLISQF